MKNNTKIIAIFGDTVTEKALSEIESKHMNLVHDFSNEEEFKAARKVNAEMNKLLKEVDRVGIDAAKEVTEMRNQFKERIESAYSGTITPFKIEDQRRKDEKKRIEDAKKARIAEQENKLSMIKGASARAIHLSYDEIEDILQQVMSVDIESFDDDMKQDAKFAKDVSLAQLQDAFKYAEEKEAARKEAELKEAELADKNDEIEALKAQLAAMQTAPPRSETGVFKVRVEWSGYSRGYSVYEVEAGTEEEAKEIYTEGNEIARVTVRDDTESEEVTII